MLALGPGARLYFYTGACDMRKGFAGLSGVVRSALGRDPADGAIYCFVNRRRDRIKLLCFEGDGYAVYYKVLAEGTLEVPQSAANASYATVTPETLRLILGGVKLASVVRRKALPESGLNASICWRFSLDG